MATPSLFPMFLLPSSGGPQVPAATLWGGSVDALVPAEVIALVQGEVSVDEEDAPLVIQPSITVVVEGEVTVDFEVCK